MEIGLHFYADDTQLYISFSSSDSLTSLSLLSTTLDSVYSWLVSNCLSVNPSKTISSYRQPSTTQENHLVFDFLLFHQHLSYRLGRKSRCYLWQQSFFQQANIRCLQELFFPNLSTKTDTFFS